jgi:hypothetical protein
MNMYTAKDIRAIINWMGHDKLLPYLESQGVHAAHEVSTAKRTFRLYDEAALMKCKGLRAQRDAEMGLAKPPAAEPYAPSVAALHLTIERMAEEIAHIRKQVDTLVKELSGTTAIFDDEGSGGTD